MSLRFVLAASVVLMPAVAVAAPYAPDFFQPGSPERNAAAVALWFVLIAVAAAFVIHASTVLTESRSATRRAAIEVERARLRVRRRAL